MRSNPPVLATFAICEATSPEHSTLEDRGIYRKQDLVDHRTVCLRDPAMLPILIVSRSVKLAASRSPRALPLLHVDQQADPAPRRG